MKKIIIILILIFIGSFAKAQSYADNCSLTRWVEISWPDFKGMAKNNQKITVDSLEFIVSHHKKTTEFFCPQTGQRLIILKHYKGYRTFIAYWPNPSGGAEEQNNALAFGADQNEIGGYFSKDSGGAFTISGYFAAYERFRPANSAEIALLRHVVVELCEKSTRK